MSVKINGRTLQRSIIAEANKRGWRAASFPPVETARGWRTPAGAQGKGWPDIVLVRDRVIYVEVKGDGDRLRPEQREWQDALRLAGAEVYVWTPKEWGDTILSVLDRRGPATVPLMLVPDVVA
jgi:acetyl esterase/lipase